MSSDQPEPVDGSGAKKKRQRPCDRCRQKKRRCDGGATCEQCAKSNVTCTYDEPAPTRHSGPQYDTQEYIETLKSRLETAEDSLERLRKHRKPNIPIYARAIRRLGIPQPPPHPDDTGYLDIVDSFGSLSLDGAPADPGFHGKSSAAMLVKTAVDVKKDNEQSSMRRQTPPLLKPWALKPWESRHWIPPHTWTFPDNSLMESLVSLYFLNVNCFIPVLHRPIFEECLKHRLHMSHPGFGTVVLLVCALGSLYLTGPDPTKVDRETMAWKWYNQVEMCGHFLCQLPTLYDLQAYCLAAQFLHCTSNPRFAWIIVGFALRLVQDVALHRGKPRGPTITADEELEKRALWTLLFLDTQISGFLGRYAALDVVEIDISLPCECDDDYWRSSGPGFQPPDKPSVLAFFNCLLQLYRIFHFTIRSLYTTRASHLRSRTINDLPDIAMELDSALDKWFCTIPEHLLWNQDQSSSLFFDQSAVLNCFYCYTRILINRPSIPGLFSMPPPNPIALEICVEAARSCIEVADTHRQRRSDSCYPLFFSQGPVFTAATILIIGHWSHSNEQPEAIDDLALVRTAINIFHTQQERWPSSEFYATVLERLISIEGNSQAQLDYHNSLPVQPDLHTSSDWIRGHSALSRVTAPIWTEGQMVDEEALDDAPQVAIPPAFVGDEEIIPRQARRPRVIG